MGFFMFSPLAHLFPQVAEFQALAALASEPSLLGVTWVRVPLIACPGGKDHLGECGGTGMHVISDPGSELSLGGQRW